MGRATQTTCLGFSVEGYECWMINVLCRAQAASGHGAGRSGEDEWSWAVWAGLGLKLGAQKVLRNCPLTQRMGACVSGSPRPPSGSVIC